MKQISDLHCSIETLQQDSVITPFESEDEELNDFLVNDSKNYLNSMLAVTYVLRTTDEIFAYFSLSNDRLIRDGSGTPEWNRLNRPIANDKRRKSYPAVKIGRLAVARQYAGIGFGKAIIETVINMYAKTKAQAGCRFITVDAYQNALGFYQKNGFGFLTEDDATEETRAMYLDLKAFV
ncbi:MAG: GNAT family N-acetyltransferase [Fibromonadaceae bacterium]|jgi:GNAT superfamily N-acetyltransferase|nr:GNAT family N-acetyltransferase [Fibromonadaceae bacterium]